jgi:pimeloyl-ACP methyl ester carboxylesterase
MALLLALFSAVALAAGVAFPSPIALTTLDGKVLQANVGVPAKAVNGVVFVHMAGRNKEDWHSVADKLYRQGLLVLTIDLRGHGANVTGAAPTLTGADWIAMTEDVAAGVAELRKRGAQKVALVGAEAGANLALLAAAADPTITSVALLSPGLDYKGLATGEAAKRYGPRPVFYAASRDDTYGLRSATALDSVATGPHSVQVFEKAGKGTAMFNREPTLESQLLGFLNTSWTVAVAPAAGGPTAIKVKTEDLTTTGTKLGERPVTAPK